MSLIDRIANYFKEWDGIDETAPKMELSIDDLRYIANMYIERNRLIKQLNESNLKIETLLLDKTQENRNKTIDEFANKAIHWNNISTKKVPYAFVKWVAEEMKEGVKNA